MLEIQSQLARLNQRVEQLERQHARTTRGHLNQRRAADYISKSREYLRQRALHGDGPRRNPDGTYPIDGLDKFIEQTTGRT